MRESASINQYATSKVLIQRMGNAGFTLIELMVTVVILGIVAAYAIPGFQNLVESNRVTSQTNNLLSAFKSARSEAVNRGQSVTLTAVGGDFTQGWCIYEGASGSNCASVTPIRQFDAADGVSIGSVSGDTSFQFDGRGRMVVPDTAVNIHVEPVDCNGEADARRVISISVAGRTSFSEDDCD